ncbi:MAG TPA: glycerophosphodiester phosphodiesterase [Cytophagales bacterium]|nr:glycerophosphodiester phosphodiesterase [Cytophagales bacterium]
MKKTSFALIAVVLLSLSCKKKEEAKPIAKYNTLTGNAPLVIAHRGASGDMPEHTLEAYSRAIEQGADFVEPDLVVTKDGYLIARHEPFLGGTTDIASRPEFASKKSKKSLDGVDVEDWFASDLTLAEIKTLRAIQPNGDRDPSYNGLFTIPTFEEVIQLVKQKSAAYKRTVGIYPETKHPTFHESLNLKITDKLLEALDKAGWNHGSAPVYVQSFEVGNLQYINSKSSVRLVQLLDANDVKKDGTMDMTAPYGQPYDFVTGGDSRTYNDLITEAGLNFIKSYADGIGPWKPYVIPYTFEDQNADGAADDVNGDGKVNNLDFTKLPETGLIKKAHAKNLFVHAYTFRNEGKRLLSDYNNDPVLEYKDFFDLGVDGVFTDFPETAVRAK